MCKVSIPGNMVSLLTWGFELNFSMNVYGGQSRDICKTFEKELIHHADTCYSVTWNSFHAVSPWLKVLPSFVVAFGS